MATSHPFSTFLLTDVVFSHRAPDLGVQLWHCNIMGDLEVVAIDQLSGQLVLSPIKV
ncbi:hypothetical protein PAXRUDRAFT_162568 [Paxillus rubicundulus Ve08.2h10]|uniref:Uncharacterized protein n=1 Tax=Paxillus rubicundulus Ve08.2h10 TaxID=930991 RepID=A0A0D0DDY4_9AGAM|nr:hypothetical protein PAXRUDRAFT_162568 [Paxillus rubicundulus Ve08.2h10]